MNRRYFLGSLAAATAIRGSGAQMRLKFRSDGTFTVLMISDLHYSAKADPYGIALTENLIAKESPDVVIVAGDCLSGDRCHTREELEAGIANVAAAMERKTVPWAITFGNHDQGHFASTNIGKERVMALYERYPHNINAGWVRGIRGVGNRNIPILNSAGTEPVFALWLMDSGDYTKNREDNYDWIHADQVNWYVQTSEDLEKQHGGKLPGLMFFHIPLLEFKEMAATKRFTGERHESESTSAVNGGMFAGILERGDVKGVFCGHDHVNSYVGLWRGVCLGYDALAGYDTYPHLRAEDPANGSIRGGRVFRIVESDAWRFKTWMRFQDESTNGEFSAG
jgi:UDP-2,3-diacylglucosamine pyrophosphatase LpxH